MASLTKHQIIPTYRDYNRLLRNQVLLAIALENIAALPWDARSDERRSAIDACKTLVSEVDEFTKEAVPCLRATCQEGRSRGSRARCPWSYCGQER